METGLSRNHEGGSDRPMDNSQQHRARPSGLGLDLGRLGQLQQSIATSMTSAALAAAQMEPAIFAAMQRSSILCRAQLHQSAGLLRNVGRTADLALVSLDDLEVSA